jgi:asparagine synthase (glutamine-hydrolysing)
MCGIWAILGHPQMREKRQALIDRLAARGPEYTAYTEIPDTPVALGFTRLAINGLTPEGHQPFVKHGIHVVCNGEIYNYVELAEAWNISLREGTSDCAVLAELITHLDATEFCRTLDGVFAMVLVDVPNQTVYVARDPFGVRPLFEGVFPTGERMWASEMKALSKDCVSVKPFPPGTWRSYSFDGTMRCEVRYHTRPPLHPILSDHEEARSSLRTALVSAVQKRLLSDRPIGALLSGGLDSSLVCAIAAKELAKVGKRLSTFSIGMPGSTDLQYARLVADHIGSDHHEILVDPSEFLKAIPSVIKAIESYDITTVRASVGNWLVGKYIREKTDIKVVFNGDGSDETGGGYLYFYKAPSDEAFEREVGRLLDEIHLYDVLRSDRSMAAHGLEARTPFLDKRVVATWRSISTELRRPGPDRMEKQILREAFDTGLLPIEVLYRKKEAFSDGVSSVADSWYRMCSDYADRATTVQTVYTHNPPLSKEAYWYRSLFAEAFGDAWATVIPHMWLPQWVKGGTDPSARTLKDLY